MEAHEARTPPPFPTTHSHAQDDDAWSAHGIKAGSQLMMMGTAGDLPAAPPAATVFVEDMHATDAHVVRGVV
jgi:ubiquitin carboxyl-terminal hydrolase 14